MIIKLLGQQIALTSANSIANAGLVYIVNSGAAATANIAYANSTVYANVTVTNTFPVIIQKTAGDLITGTSTMFAAPIAFKH